jgi:hypothetical protein
MTIDKSIILGTSRFNLLNQYQVDELLSCALELGVTSLDTAPSYHTSERKIGDFNRRYPGMFEVTTKILRDKENRSADSVAKSIENSLKYLNVESIRTLYVHGTKLSYQDEEILAVLRSFENMGLINKLGWCGTLNPDFDPPESLFQELMVRVNPWDVEILERKDLIGKYSIIGMNVFANWFWNYRPWSVPRSTINAYLFRRFNPAPTNYISHPEREKLKHMQNFDQLMSFTLSCDFLKAFVIGTNNSSHLAQVVGRRNKFLQ